ncbi:MAG: aminopeptidase N C-terminal domain-containing protein, partial [Pseudomonadota bacterium]
IKADEELASMLTEIACDTNFEPAYRALCLTPPTATEIARDIGTSIDPIAIHEGREAVLNAIARYGERTFSRVFQANRVNVEFEPTADQAGARALRGVMLSYLARRPSGATVALDVFEASDNMTDRLTALTVLAHQFPGEDKTNAALEAFRTRYRNEPMVLDKWLSIQAMTPDENTLDTVTTLTRNPVFSWQNPNRVRAVLGAFATGNPVAFNRADGAAYAFFCDSVLKLDRINPQVAARLMTAMRSWKDLEPVRQEAARSALTQLADRSSLSRDLRDILDRTLDRKSS